MDADQLLQIGRQAATGREKRRERCLAITRDARADVPREKAAREHTMRVMSDRLKQEMKGRMRLRTHLYQLALRTQMAVHNREVASKDDHRLSQRSSLVRGYTGEERQVETTRRRRGLRNSLCRSCIHHVWYCQWVEA